MEEFKILLGVAWTFGKYYFKEQITTPEQYEAYTIYGNNLLKQFKPNTKQYRFVKALLVAVDAYTAEEWAEVNKTI